MSIVCKECSGAGVVDYTRERGGPACQTCGGSGFMKSDVIQRVIASILDHPSVYMGGPSRGSIMKAEKVVDYLKKIGAINE